MESVSPYGVRAIQNESVPFVFHPISHAWFNDSTQMWTSLERMLRTQAVWSGVAIVEASNMKESVIYQADGTVTQLEVDATTDRILIRSNDG